MWGWVINQRLTLYIYISGRPDDCGETQHPTLPEKEWESSFVQTAKCQGHGQVDPNAIAALQQAQLFALQSQACMSRELDYRRCLASIAIGPCRWQLRQRKRQRERQKAGCAMLGSALMLFCSSVRVFVKGKSKAKGKGKTQEKQTIHASCPSDFVFSEELPMRTEGEANNCSCC